MDPKICQILIGTASMLSVIWIKRVFMYLIVYCLCCWFWMNPHVVWLLLSAIKGGQLPYFHTLRHQGTPHRSQYSPQAHLQRINSFPVSYSDDLITWSNNFKTINQPQIENHTLWSWEVGYQLYKISDSMKTNAVAEYLCLFQKHDNSYVIQVYIIYVCSCFGKKANRMFWSIPHPHWLHT